MSMTESQFEQAFHKLLEHRDVTERSNLSHKRNLRQSLTRASRLPQLMRELTGTLNNEILFSVEGNFTPATHDEAASIDSGLGFLASDIVLGSHERHDGQGEVSSETFVHHSRGRVNEELTNSLGEQRSRHLVRSVTSSIGLDFLRLGLAVDYASLVKDRNFFEVDESCLGADLSSGLLLLRNPASLYYDLLRVNLHSCQLLEGLQDTLPFKNNLLVIVVDAVLTEPLLVVACNSCLLFYPIPVFGSSTSAPVSRPTFRFDSRPLLTSLNDVRAAVSGTDPHSINYIKFNPCWLGDSVLAACTDDGRILIWKCRRIYEQIHQLKFHQRNRPSYYGMRMLEDYELRLGSSCWSVDFSSFNDMKGMRHHIAVGSCNAHIVKLFYYNQSEDTFEVIESPPMSHNIPDVSVISYQITEDIHQIHVCVACISGHVAIMEFQFQVSKGFHNATSKILRVAEFSDDCWTAKPVAGVFFRPVRSFKALSGAKDREEKSMLEHIKAESKILSPWDKECNLAPKIQHSFVPSLYWKEGGASCGEQYLITSKDDDSQKMRDILYSELVEGVSPLFLDMYLAVTTPEEVALLRGDSLFCQANSGELFDFEDFKCRSDLGWSDRISLSVIVPELLALIMATQAGLLTIMRLCQYKGHKAMRQEYVLPGSSKDSNFSRTIIGISTMDISALPEFPRSLLCVIFSDGKALFYELAQEGDIDNLDMTRVDF